MVVNRACFQIQAFVFRLINYIKKNLNVTNTAKYLGITISKES